MGGHGGLNILPQKSWNVYNFDNREKVKKDEEAAAKEEQIKREQSRKRDTEFRLDKLRASKGLPPSAAAAATGEASASTAVVSNKSKHINLFEGLKIFPLGDAREEVDDQGRKMKKRLKKEETPKVLLPEDEVYRFGCGVAGKGVKAPWYVSKPSSGAPDGDSTTSESGKREGSKHSGKKTLEELREERLKREKREKERERALMLEKNRQRNGAATRVQFSRAAQDPNRLDRTDRTWSNRRVSQTDRTERLGVRF